MEDFERELMDLIAKYENDLSESEIIVGLEMQLGVLNDSIASTENDELLF